MKNAYLKRLGAVIFLGSILPLVSLVSGAAQTDVNFIDAASYYRDAKCVVCHGPKGEKKFDADKKEDELIETILRGKKTERPPNMPAFEAKGLTADQAKELIAYMKTLKTQ